MKDVTFKIHVKQFRQQRALRHGEEPPEGAELVETATGNDGVIETVSEASATTITVPGAVIERLVADNREIGGKLSVQRLIADHVERGVMPHHADQEHWTKVEVTDPGDIEGLQEYLQRRFIG